jgi:hypothetical protein
MRPLHQLLRLTVGVHVVWTGNIKMQMTSLGLRALLGKHVVPEKKEARHRKL